MATTANYGWPTPDGAVGVAPDIPGDMKKLADAADASMKTIDNKTAVTTTYGNTSAVYGTGPTQITQALPSGVSSLVGVRIQAPNYFYDYVLAVWQSPFNGGGAATTLSKNIADNNAQYNDPTFQVAQGALYITNSKYPANTVTILTRVIQIGFAG